VHAAATILVVDDGEASRALAQNALEGAGYRVVLARGGAEGLAAFERERPDCVLLDIPMPDLDGYVVCEQIRALSHGGGTPVLLLAALRGVDGFDRMLHAGGDDFVTKPICPAELVARVQSALRGCRLNIERRESYELLEHERDGLQRRQLQQRRLMAFVVHDLKNPVHAMDLHAQVLQREPGLPATASESVRHIRAEARQLHRMILNLLDISKADEGGLTPKRCRVDLPPLVKDVLSELGMSAEGRRVGLRSEIHAQRIHADEDLLRRTLTNLLENAIRYAPSETSVTVTAAPLAGWTEVRVLDGGRGVAPEMRERVFDPFVRLDAGTAGSVERSGRGLGLAFCKLAVEAHGGQIWVEDARPGAAFCVRFPE
jgi:signal transduction histidine kinase